MLCPYCGGKTTVTETIKEANLVYRQRKCLNNKYHRFKTVETVISEEAFEGRKEKRKHAED